MKKAASKSAHPFVRSFLTYTDTFTHRDRRTDTKTHRNFSEFKLNRSKMRPILQASYILFLRDGSLQHLGCYY